MAHSLSANKRVRQTAKRRERNRNRRKALKFQTKKFLGIIEKADKAAAETELRATIKKIDQISAKHTIHKKTAARRKSRLAKRLNALKAGGAASVKA